VPESFAEWLARKSSPPSFRADGTLKGQGYFGTLPGPGGTEMTEYSIGVTGPEYDWKETEIPLLIPTLTEEERKYLQAGGEPTPEIERKAREFAEQRRNAGKSPFAQPGEQPQKRSSFSEWLALKAGKGPISGFQAPMATPLPAPPEKAPPWGSLARGPRVPGTAQTPLSPKAMIAGTGAPGEAMPSGQQYALMPPEEQAAWQQWHKKTIEPPPLVPEIQTQPPSVQRAFERRQEGIEAELGAESALELAKAVVKPVGKMGFARLPDVWKQTAQGGVEYMPTIAEKISDKIATGQDLSKIESLGNRALMLDSGIVNGFTAGLFADAYKDQMIPQDVVDELLYQGGHLAGWIKGWPAEIGKIFQGQIAKPAIAALSKVIRAAPKTQAWLQYLGGATRLGAMSAASDLNQPPEEVAKAGLSGTALGAVFQGTALIDVFKSPVINQMARQVGSRALANLIGAYDPKIITALKDDPAQALPAIVDEIFMSYFSAPGKSPGKMMKEWHQANVELAKYNQEYKAQLKTSPEIGRIVRNLSTIEELAFRPGTERRQTALAQENEALIEIYRDRHALVPVTAGRTFEAGPGGKITPPGELPGRLRMRQRAEELREEKRQAEGLATRTAEYEKEREPFLPVPVPKEPEPGFYMGMRGEVPPEIALEPEGKRMKRELIAERQLAAQQRRVEEGIVERMKPAPAPAPEAPAPTPPPEVLAPTPVEKKPAKAPVAVPPPAPAVAKPVVVPKPAKPAVAEVPKPTAPPPAPVAARPVVKPAASPVKPVLEPKAPGVLGRHVPPGEYALRGNFLYKGNRAVFDLNVMAKDLVYKNRDAKRRVQEGTLTPEGYQKIKNELTAQASKEYESYEPWKEPPKPAEIYKVKQTRIAREREVVANAIKAGRQQTELLKPWTEEAEKSPLAQAIEKHRDFKDAGLRVILENLYWDKPAEITKIRKLGLGSIERFKTEKFAFQGKVGKKPGVGLSLQRVTPRSPEDLELDRALAERRIPGTSIRIPSRVTPDPASDFVIRSETKAAEERERHWLPGFTVLGNLKRMGAPGKLIAKAGDKFIFEQNSDTSRDQYLAKGAQKMIAHSMRKSGELKDIPFLKRSEVIGKRIIDLAENKVKPANEHETAAQGIIKEIFKDMAQQSEILGLKIKTAFGREVPWAERENYFPQVWKKAGLEKFLTSDEMPFRHLRDFYLEHLAKEMDPDLFKSDPKEAVRQVEMKWREIRNDLKSRPFANLEMSRILDGEVLEKLQAKWAAAYPGQKFPLERDTGLHVLMNYISGGRTRLAWVRNFGKDVRTEKGDFAPELIYETIPKMNNQANYDYTLNFFRQYLTRSGFDTKTTRLLRDIRTAQLWKLGTAFIPNSLQWFTNVMPLVSTKTGLQGLMDSARALKGEGPMKEYFMKSGARTMKSAMREALMEDASKINGFADAMLKTHLFSGTEYWNALYAAMVGGRKAIEVSGKLAARPEAYRAKAWENELKKLGLEDSDIAQIKGGKPVEMGSSEYLRAMFEMRKNTQFLSDAFHLPKTWSHPFGRAATQFKNFAYNQTRLIITEPMAEAWKFAKTLGREGDITKLMKAMVILPAAGALITKAKEETYKVFGIHFYEDLLAGKSWPVKLGIFLANTGGLGIATDVLGAIGYGTKGMAQLLGGPTASDLMSFTEAMGNTWKEVKTAIANKNSGWVSHRGTAIKEYWLRMGERISPDARIIIQNFFPSWKDAKTATNWSAVYKEATKTYKENYKLQGESVANEFWDAWMATQGAEYAEIFGKQPRKPTAKEIDNWWEEQGKPTTERMKMPGISEEGEGGTGGTYLW